MNVTSNGGSTAFSVNLATATIVVTDVNDAPVLDASGTMTLTGIGEDDLDNSGNTVAEVISTSSANGGNAITDVDPGALEGGGGHRRQEPREAARREPDEAQGAGGHPRHRRRGGRECERLVPAGGRGTVCRDSISLLFS